MARPAPLGSRRFTRRRSTPPTSILPAPAATPAAPAAPGGPAAPGPGSGNRRRGPAHLAPKSGPSGARQIVEWVVILVAALTVAIVVKTFLVQAFYIPSGSMEPTLKPGDRVLVNKLSYDLHSIHRGDIVVFKRPPSEAGDPTIKDLIKRVIGLPGDQIESRDGVVYVNGQLLKEPYLPPGTVTTSLPLTKVAPGMYFVMGDNRGNSKDSRFIGAIPGHLIVGRAFVRVWPLSGLGLL